jgi:hypothetical protein
MLLGCMLANTCNWKCVMVCQTSKIDYIVVMATALQYIMFSEDPGFRYRYSDRFYMVFPISSRQIRPTASFHILSSSLYIDRSII